MSRSIFSRGRLWLLYGLL